MVYELLFPSLILLAMLCCKNIWAYIYQKYPFPFNNRLEKIWVVGKGILTQGFLRVAVSVIQVNNQWQKAR